VLVGPNGMSVRFTAWLSYRKGIRLSLLLATAVWLGPAAAAEQGVRPTAAGFPGGIVPIDDLVETNQVLAQRIVLAADEVQRRAVDSPTGQPLRVEVFTVRPATEADLSARAVACPMSSCYRVDLYNFALNASFFALADLAAGRLVYVSPDRAWQPDLPQRLVDQALEIATRAPEVIKALGFVPGERDAVMPQIKTALNDTECESSKHLCVAPTFVLHDEGRALWAIVDLTAGKLIGVRWTDLGAPLPVRPTQRVIQREEIYNKYCRTPLHLEQGRWRFDYIISGSDGLRISDLHFGDHPLIRSAKLVDWHVSYSTTDGFGYSDAIGSPMFSAAAVGAVEAPSVEEIRQDGEAIGFALVQDFVHPQWPAPCNYRYKQRYEFYDDGRFRIAGGQYGRGCGIHGFYRPVFRIDFFPDAANRFEEWTGEGWRPWEKEGWTLQPDGAAGYDGSFPYRIQGRTGERYYIEPGRGQFAHNRGDNAYVYVTRYKSDEGDADMSTIGSCCNTDHRQGPEQFVDDPPEDILDQDFTLWYVAQLQNDDAPGKEYCWAALTAVDGLYEPVAWPCYAGPMFVPAAEMGETSSR